MISFKHNKIGPNLESLTSIKEIKVVWITPRGIIADARPLDSLHQATELCEADKLDPDASIRPAVMAIGEDGYNEIIG